MRVRPSDVQPQDRSLDVLVPCRGERCLGPDWLEAHFWRTRSEPAMSLAARACNAG
jgi:hypothetical protein